MLPSKVLVGILTFHKPDYKVTGITRDWLEEHNVRLKGVRRIGSRRTWLTELPEGVDYKFFYGTEQKTGKRAGGAIIAPAYERIPDLPEPHPDEVYLPVGDSYEHTPHKTQAMCKYAYTHNYDYLIRVDDDTFMFPRRVFAAMGNWAAHDYSGSLNGGFISGFFLILSRRAMRIIGDAPITSAYDDRWIGDVMKKAGIKPHPLPAPNRTNDKYILDPDDKIDDNAMAVHSCSPRTMELVYRRYKNDVAK